MSDLNTERSKAWTMYTASNPSQAAGEEAPWKSSFGTSSSMSAVSFGFVATAILISMFLIMAIIEHFFKLTPQFSSAESMPESSTSRHHHRELAPTAKHANPQTVASSSSSSPSYACDMSVLMPGQQYPSYIAQPAPLPLPCPREGTYWPSHSRHHI